MPAAQVFGPTTVDPGFTTTGEKTLLTMATSLPAGGKNIIIATMMPNGGLSSGSAQGTFAIKKGTTALYGSYLTQYLNYGTPNAKPTTIVAVDDSPAGNDTYTFTVNITATGTATGVVHVQGIVFKASDAYWTYNTTSVSVAAGATATVLSLNTSFPIGTKFVIIGIAYGYNAGNIIVTISAGNVRLKSGTTIVSSNQFLTGGAGGTQDVFWEPLMYTGTTTSSSQTYSIEVRNNSVRTYAFYAELLAFRVGDAAFLDTGSVTLTSGSQVTVGNLSTTLSGDVAVIALPAAVNTGSTSVTAFTAGGVVLQLNNLTTGQIANQVSWRFAVSEDPASSGVMSMFRFDSGVSSPSYQVKMTANASGINGEAKILAFIPLVAVAYTKELSESTSLADAKYVSVAVAKVESASLLDSRMVKPILSRSESVGMMDSMYRFAGKVLAESAGMLDMAVKHASTSMAESATLVDSLVAFKVLLRVLEELVTLADAITKDASTAKAESLATIDALARMAATAKAESMVLTDTVAKTSSLPRDEMVALADYLLKSVGKVLLDVAALADQFSRTWLAHLTLDESTSLTDVIQTVKTKLLELAEVLSLLDTRILEAGKMLAETTTASDVMVKDAFKAVAETVTLLDMITKKAAMARAEVMALSDVLERRWAAVRTMAESIGLADTLAALKVFLRILEETLRLVESFAHDWLYIEGDVTVGDDIVGSYSVSYKDFIRDGLPIQSARHKVWDRVLIGDGEVGWLGIEWEDKVADITPGTRMLYVLSTVELVEEWEAG